MWRQIGLVLAAGVSLTAGALGAKEDAKATGPDKGEQAAPAQVRVEAEGNAIVLEGPRDGKPGQTQQYHFGPFGLTVSGNGPVVIGNPAGGMPAGTFKISDYWIGVECLPALPVLRAQLKLSADQGLMVAAVVPDSPAAKAGIKEHDVLLSAGDKKLSVVPDLMNAVDAAKDKKFVVELLRAGERKKLEVQPAKRPAQTLPGGTVDWGLPRNDADLNTIRQWMQQMAVDPWEPGSGKGPWQFHIVRPGAILPGGGGPKLPADTTVTITRHGDEPAKIVVHKGDQHWEVTAAELDKLPADIRAAVEPMLAGPGVTGLLSLHRHEARRPAKDAEKTPANAGDLEKQLDQLKSKVEEVQKALEQMRSGKLPAKTPDEPRGARL